MTSQHYEPAQERLDLVRLLVREQSFIMAYAYAIVRDHHLAEDVYQEVALILANEWGTIPADAPRPWLKEMVRRKALEVARRARRHVLLSPETLAALAGAFSPDSSAARGCGEDYLLEAMAACVQKLPEEIRRLIDARYREGLSCEGVAERIGRSVQGVYAMLKRARAALAQCVDRTMLSQVPDAGHE